MTATVAILGRPNVGKSTLFNRLTGRKTALVDNQPGVTRDRREGEGRIGGLEFRVFDTAGLDAESSKSSLEGRMSAQSERAIDEADLVFFVIDAKTGVTPADSEFAQRIRRRGRPVVVIANKAERRAANAGIIEGYELGFGEPLPISAEHGEGMDLLHDAILAHSPPGDEVAAEREDRPLKLAIVGQPNSGKSTLVNVMLGSERMLTGPEAGITRDAISSDFEWQGRKIKLWDTAGIRRKAKVTSKIEKLAVADALRAIQFAECVVVLIDASLPIERQDLALSDLVAQEGRAIVLALNKWDLVEDKQKTLKQVESDLEDVLPEIRGAAVVTLSAQRESGLDRLMNAVFEAVEKWNRRIPTAQLNRWLESALERNPPPAPSGRRIKIRYMTQANARPPTFAIFGNQLSKLPESYLRYLMTGLRKEFDLWGTPLRFSLRGGRNPYEKSKR